MNEQELADKLKTAVDNLNSVFGRIGKIRYLYKSRFVRTTIF